MAKKKLKKKAKITIQVLTLIVMLIVLVIIGTQAIKYYQTDNQKLVPVDQKEEYYNISDFGFVRETSSKDYNNNGKDDYTDILEGEKKYAEFNPKYKSNYYAEGYPPVEKEGVCTDLIWYSLKNAGYSLKDLIDKDIKNNRKKYDIKIVDSNIDFRRVINQDVFFSRYAKELTTDMYEIGQFIPGDILVFDYGDHIAMVSDKYTKDGVPYLIQNRDEKQKQKEENRLEKTDMEITSHYRFEYNKKLEKLINRVNGKN